MVRHGNITDFADAYVQTLGRIDGSLDSKGFPAFLAYDGLEAEPFVQRRVKSECLSDTDRTLRKVPQKR